MSSSITITSRLNILDFHHITGASASASAGVGNIAIVSDTHS